MKQFRRKAVIFLCIILMSIPSQSILASSAGKIVMDGVKKKYSGTEVKVSVDNRNVNIIKNPGIVVNGIALLPYDVVFKKALGSTCSYQALTKKLTISKNGNKVSMTLGSSIAYVNGVKKTVPVTPRKVYFSSAKVSKIMVPSRFVAQALGYTYNWNSKTSTVEIKSPYSLYYGKQWHVYTGTKGGVKVNGTALKVSDMPTVIFNGIAMIQAKKVFNNKKLNASYRYDSATKQVTIKNTVHTVKYMLNNKVAYVNGKKCTLKTAPKVIKDNVSKKSYVMIPAKFTTESLGYDYNWNSSSKMSEIAVTSQKLWTWNSNKVNVQSVCTNTLQSITVQEKKGEETVEFIGAKPLYQLSSFSEENNTLSITIANLNNISTKLTDIIKNSDNLTKIELSECETGNLTILMTLSDNAAYYESETGDSYTIHFCKSQMDVEGDLILLEKPNGVSFEDIKWEDCYYKKQFKIYIPGNHVSYFKNIGQALPDGIKTAKCTLNESGNTVLTFDTSEILGFKLTDKGEKFAIQVGKPKNIYKNIVLLDAGHGGTDPGCVANGHQEKDINFNILYKYAKAYFNGADSPVKAYWTRTTDTKIDLTKRGAYADTVGADIFISLHMNSAGASSANGTETYYCNSNNKKNSYGMTSSKLASYFQKNWSSQIGLSTTRGVKTANYVVIKKNTVPAILIELGFMTSTKDIAIIGSAASQKKAAKSFYETVCEFFQNYPTSR